MEIFRISYIFPKICTRHSLAAVDQRVEFIFLVALNAIVRVVTSPRRHAGERRRIVEDLSRVLINRYDRTLAIVDVLAATNY